MARTFREWLRDYATRHDTPAWRDLCADIQKDPDWPHSSNRDVLREYLLGCGAVEGCIATFDEAYDQYDAEKVVSNSKITTEVRLDTDTPSFGVLLRSYRRRAKITLLELSRLAKCHEASICRVERGDRDVSRGLAMALARGLNLDEEDADRLMASAGYCPPSVAALGWDSTLTSICRVLLDDTLPDDDLATFRAVIESLSAKWVPKHPDLREG